MKNITKSGIILLSVVAWILAVLHTVIVIQCDFEKCPPKDARFIYSLLAWLSLFSVSMQTIAFVILVENLI